MNEDMRIYAKRLLEESKITEEDYLIVIRENMLITYISKPSEYKDVTCVYAVKRDGDWVRLLITSREDVIKDIEDICGRQVRDIL